MENREINDSQWSDRQMGSLEPDAAWQPDAARGMMRLKSLDRSQRRRRRGMLWTLAAALAACAVLTVLQSPQACATPLGCASTGWRTLFHSRLAPAHPPVAPGVGTAVTPETSAPAGEPGKEIVRPVSPPRAKNFHESGAADAAVTVEIYSDFMCPACARLYLDTVPLLKLDYVTPGKAKLLHRDYPLAQHAFSRLAARYANAAGEVGHYDEAVEQLFRTQDRWGQNGNIEGDLAKVLPEDVMQEVRRRVSSEEHLEDSITSDVQMGAQDGLTSTPTIVIVAKGKRQVLGRGVSYEELKRALEQVLEPPK
jgi:protein-disulfide isomerase